MGAAVSAVTPEVERAAQAAYDARGFGFSGESGGWDVLVERIDWNGNEQDEWRIVSRAALASLEPPSPAMVEAAAQAACDRTYGDGAWERMEAKGSLLLIEYRVRARIALTAAIRAAIGEKP